MEQRDNYTRYPRAILWLVREGGARIGGGTFIPGAQSTADDIFETSSNLSRTDSQISYGNRVSQFGFTDMFGQAKREEVPVDDMSRAMVEPQREPTRGSGAKQAQQQQQQ